MKPVPDIRAKARRKHARRHTKKAKVPLPELAPPVPVLLIRGKVVQEAPVLLPVRVGNDVVWKPNPRFPSFASEITADRVTRERLAKTLERYATTDSVLPMAPSARPKSRTVTLRMPWPNIRKLIEMGYPYKAALAVLPASSPLNQIVTDRHKMRAVIDPEKEDEVEDKNKSGGKSGGNRSGVVSDHAVVVEQSLSRREALRRGQRIREAADGRISEALFLELLAKPHRQARFDLPMQAALRETLVVGRRVADVARARKVDRRALSEATRRIRKEAFDAKLQATPN